MQPTFSVDERSRLFIGFGLAAVMAATRSQYLAPLGHHLPDASLAVFFLGGFYLRQLGSFTALCVLATGIDFIAINWGGVSSHCITFAYWLLIPAYGVVWTAGRWYAAQHQMNTATLTPLGLAVMGGGIGSQVIASGGFYAWSGYFDVFNMNELLGRFATYMPTTLLYLAVYISVAALVHVTVLRMMPARS